MCTMRMPCGKLSMLTYLCSQQPWVKMHMSVSAEHSHWLFYSQSQLHSGLTGLSLEWALRGYAELWAGLVNIGFLLLTSHAGGIGYFETGCPKIAILIILGFYI